MTTAEYEKKMLETGSKRMKLVDHICELASGNITEDTLVEVKENLDRLLNDKELQIPLYNE